MNLSDDFDPSAAAAWSDEDDDELEARDGSKAGNDDAEDDHFSSSTKRHKRKRHASKGFVRRIVSTSGDNLLEQIPIGPNDHLFISSNLFKDNRTRSDLRKRRREDSEASEDEQENLRKFKEIIVYGQAIKPIRDDALALSLESTDLLIALDAHQLTQTQMPHYHVQQGAHTASMSAAAANSFAASSASLSSALSSDFEMSTETMNQPTIPAVIDNDAAFSPATSNAFSAATVPLLQANSPVILVDRFDCRLSLPFTSLPAISSNSLSFDRSSMDARHAQRIRAERESEEVGVNWDKLEELRWTGSNFPADEEDNEKEENEKEQQQKKEACDADDVVDFDDQIEDERYRFQGREHTQRRRGWSPDEHAHRRSRYDKDDSHRKSSHSIERIIWSTAEFVWFASNSNPEECERLLLAKSISSHSSSSSSSLPLDFSFLLPSHPLHRLYLSFKQRCVLLSQFCDELKQFGPPFEAMLKERLKAAGTNSEFLDEKHWLYTKYETMKADAMKIYEQRQLRES